jgi:hypothetical protein
VRDNYGEEFDWVFLDTIAADDAVVDRLPEFVVLDDANNIKKGIAIIKKAEEAKEDEK